VRSTVRFLGPAEAARRLGVSAKALRLYEQRGLVAPSRTAAGWRAYGPDEMARAGEVVALRALGLSLSQVAQVLDGDARSLEAALAAHQAALESRIRQTAAAVDEVRRLRADLGRGQAPLAGELGRLTRPAVGPSVAFDLPWPWGGEPFELHGVGPLTFITGPLGSGKTRLALRLAETLPGAVFLGLDRLAGDGAEAVRALEARAEQALAWLVEEGATVSEALRVLVAALEAGEPGALIVDMPERGLDQASQEALVAHLRRRAPGGRPVFLLTRSCAILDLTAARADEAILFCPANHAPPIRVAPQAGAPGLEALASCLASPKVRARTEGMFAALLSVA
jgi:DNA-binding transcriptional MerR regulator